VLQGLARSLLSLKRNQQDLNNNNRKFNKYMNKLKYLAAVLIAVAGMGLQQAQAHLGTGQQFSANLSGGGEAEASYLSGHGYTDECCQFLGKQEDTGVFTNGAIDISQYVTITHTTGSTWHVEWNLNGSGFTLCGVLIKDGTSGIHGESIYSFFAMEGNEGLVGSGDVSFTGEFAGRGISHLSFFGCEGGVPDGGTTVMLLGVALSGLGFMRRYLTS
jgi:hypothetical protein